MSRLGIRQRLRDRRGSVFTMVFGMVAMVGVVSVTAMNVVTGPITTASKVTHQNMAQNDLLMNAKVVVMNAATLPNMGDEDGDGYIEPVPFLPVGESECNITLPAGGQGGCLPLDIGAIQTDPWGSQYGYCVWDHGDPHSSTNRIDGEDSTSGAVLAILSAGPNKHFETPCLPYDGDPETNDIAINAKGIGDDLVQIYTYAAAVAGSGGLWELKQNEPTTAIIDKKLEIGDVSAGTGFAFDTQTGMSEFPYIKADYIASKSGGSIPVTMDSNIALDGKWLSGDGGNEGIFVATNGSVGIGTNLPEAKLHVVGAVAISSGMGTHVQDTVLPRQGAYLGWNEINGLGRTHFLNHRGTGSGGWEFNAFDSDGNYQETRLVIDQHGNVGIGTDSPASKLTVAGGLEARANNVGPAGSGVVHRIHTGPTPSGSLSWFELWGEDETARRGEAVLSGQNIVLRTGGDGAGVASLERVRIAHNGSMGIGTDSPNSTAKLDIASTTQGFLPPRMTTVQRNAINNPATGLMIFNVTDKVPEFFDGAEWLSMLGGRGNEAACAAPWGATVNHGETITAYEATGVPHGNTCSSEERSCQNGELSGSFLFQSCTIDGPTQTCVKTVTVAKVLDAHEISAALGSASSVAIQYVMVGGGGGSGGYHSSYPTFSRTGGGGGSSAIIRNGNQAIAVAAGGNGGRAAVNMSGGNGSTRSGSFVLSANQSLSFYVGGGGGIGNPGGGGGGGGGAGWFGGGGGATWPETGIVGGGGGSTVGGSPGSSLAEAGAQFKGGNASENGGAGGAHNYGGGGNGSAGGGGGFGSGGGNSGGAGGSNGANGGGTGGLGANTWANRASLILPPEAGKGSITPGFYNTGTGGNAGLIIYSYEHSNCDF